MINGIQKITAVTPKSPKTGSLSGIMYQNEDGTVDVRLEKSYKDVESAREEWNISEDEDLTVNKD